MSTHQNQISSTQLKGTGSQMVNKYGGAISNTIAVHVEEEKGSIDVEQSDDEASRRKIE